MKKNVLKRILSATLVGVLALGLLTGCKERGGDSENTGEFNPLSLSAVETTIRMGNGINLGNTLEAYGHSSYGTNSATTVYETSWGQPVTTKEMIEGMKAAGFDTIRIPVAWTNMMAFESGDYTIGQAYLDRVAEIVNWAIDAEMYVIINDHWDGGWWGMFGSATQETRDKAMEMYTSMWTQIGTYFKDYNGYLIFESANEELGDRLNDKDLCPDSGSLSEDECYTTTNKINQTFVDTIRGIGGVNEDRFLLIAGYNTNISATVDSRFVMPTDTAENKLLLSVHYYDPWSYCGADAQADWGIKSEYNAMTKSISSLSKFTDAGYGVIIGEYGALLTKEGELKNNTIGFTSAFLDQCTANDICPVLWDTGSFYSKADCKIWDTELAELFADNTYAKESESSREDLKVAANDRLSAAFDAAPAERELVIDMEAVKAEGSHAWIMWSGFKATYSVGDTYTPGSETGGVVVTDAEVTGPGTYTVGLDFSGVDGGCDTGFSFSAVGLSNGELLYPGYYMVIKEVKINGEPYTLTADPYTTADNKICTRVNLYNQWVKTVPAEARALGGVSANASAMIIDPAAFTEIKSIQVTFEYVAP